jgi:hypothetical protein
MRPGMLHSFHPEMLFRMSAARVFIPVRDLSDHRRIRPNFASKPCGGATSSRNLRWPGTVNTTSVPESVESKLNLGQCARPVPASPLSQSAPLSLFR